MLALHWCNCSSTPGTQYPHLRLVLPLDGHTVIRLDTIRYCLYVDTADVKDKHNNTVGICPGAVGRVRRKQYVIPSGANIVTSVHISVVVQIVVCSVLSSCQRPTYR